MAFRGREARLLTEKEKKRRAARTRAAESSRSSRLPAGTGVLKREPERDSITDLPNFVNNRGIEEQNIDRIISERSEGPLSREAATRQHNIEQASKSAAKRKRTVKGSTGAQVPAKKVSASSLSSDQKAAIVSQLAGAATGSSTGNIVSGALAGSAFGPVGIAAGASLGVLKNIAATKRKRRELKAASIKEQGAIAERKAKAEQDALENIRRSFTSALTIPGF